MSKIYKILKYQGFRVGASVLFYHEVFQEMMYGKICKVLLDADGYKYSADVEYVTEGRAKIYNIRLDREDFCLENLIKFKKEQKEFKTPTQTYLNTLMLKDEVLIIKINTDLFHQVYMKSYEDVLPYIHESKYFISRLSSSNIKVEQIGAVYTRRYNVTKARGVVVNSGASRFLNISGKSIHTDHWLAEKIYELYQNVIDEKMNASSFRFHENITMKLNKLIDEFNNRCFEEANRYYVRLKGDYND